MMSDLWSVPVKNASMHTVSPTNEIGYVHIRVQVAPAIECEFVSDSVEQLLGYSPFEI